MMVIRPHLRPQLILPILVFISSGGPYPVLNHPFSFICKGLVRTPVFVPPPLNITLLEDGVLVPVNADCFDHLS